MPSRSPAGGSVPWFAALKHRMRRAYITCKDWSELCSPTVTGLVQSNANHKCAIVFDPPYDDWRQSNLYARDATNLSAQVWAWCLTPQKRYGGAPADHPGFRLCICGRNDDYPTPPGWTKVLWQRGGGMDLQTQADAGVFQEALWFSPHCLDPGTETVLAARQETEQKPRQLAFGL